MFNMDINIVIISFTLVKCTCDTHVLKNNNSKIYLYSKIMCVPRNKKISCVCQNTVRRPEQSVVGHRCFVMFEHWRTKILMLGSKQS
jgi:hypothetical protein